MGISEYTDIQDGVLDIWRIKDHFEPYKVLHHSILPIKGQKMSIYPYMRMILCDLAKRMSKGHYGIRWCKMPPPSDFIQTLTIS